MKKLWVIACLLTNIVYGQTKYQQDFDQFWNDINENYAYFNQQGIDWKKVKEIYTSKAAAIKTNDDFIRLLETTLNELYNGHSSLNTNLNSSNNLIPSGADIYAEIINGRFMITDLRKGFGAEQCGLKPGMEITKFNDQLVTPQLQQFLPKFSSQYNARMYQYALSMLFAGTHDKPRKITVIHGGTEQNFYPDSFKAPDHKKNIEYKFLDKNTGYIRINNTLWNNDIIAEFDRALDSLIQTKSIVLDISETPGGGNTTVARAIMGRFITKKMPYQQHELDEPPYETRQYWIEYVLPRKTPYTGRLIVLVGHWTGSMGEGIAIGFDAMKRATVVGTKMAGLIGAISNFRLAQTGIGFQFPTERLYHINGTAREDYIPKKISTDIFDSWEQVNKILKINSY